VGFYVPISLDYHDGNQIAKQNIMSTGNFSFHILSDGEKRKDVS